MSIDGRRNRSGSRTRAAAIGAAIGSLVTLGTALAVSFGGGSPGTGSIVAAVVLAPIAGSGVAGYWYRSRSAGGWLGAAALGTGLGFTVGALLFAVVLEWLARAPLTGGAGPAVLVLLGLLGVNVVFTTVLGAIGGLAGVATRDALTASTADADEGAPNDARDPGSTDDR